MKPGIPIGYFLTLGAFAILWTYISFQGLRVRKPSRLVSVYPLFFVYLFLTISTSFSRFFLAASLGRDSTEYRHLYYGSRYLLYVTAILLIWQLYRVSGKGSRWDYAFLVALPAFLLLESLRLPQIRLYIKISNSLVCFEAVLGIMTYLRLFRNSQLRLGANQGAILAGIVIPTLLTWLDHTVYLFGAAIPYKVYAYAMEPVSILSWFLIARGMRYYDPPSWARSSGGPDPDNPGDDQQDGTLREVLDGAIGSVRRWV